MKEKIKKDRIFKKRKKYKMTGFKLNRNQKKIKKINLKMNRIKGI